MFSNSRSLLTKVTMFVTLLLTGLCITSASFQNVYYFIKKEATWDEARQYCSTEHIEMVHINSIINVSTLLKIPYEDYTDKAWIGLYRIPSNWTWVNGQPVSYQKWGDDDDDGRRLCAYITGNGTWMKDKCTAQKAVLCSGGGHNHDILLSENLLTWTEAKSFCESENAALVIIRDDETNSQIHTSISPQEAWIGLSRPTPWIWSDTGENYTFTNWQSGQPDNLNGYEECSAMVVNNGTWTDEQCTKKYPFFCTGVYKSFKTVVKLVKMKIKSSLNMEDPNNRIALQQQLVALFANHGAVNFKLTWKKLPVKETQKGND